MKYIIDSDELKLNTFETKDDINLIYQYFIHDNIERRKELEFCLKQNLENKNINKIYLLNEKIYSAKELGLTNHNNKIKQINIKNRLTFKKVFEFIKNEKINGYCVIANGDIIYDETLTNLFKTNIANEKGVFTQLRLELNKSNEINKDKIKIFGPRFDSQDVWIVHSKFIPEEKENSIFNFNFGKPGCDNKIVYLFKILGYNVYNYPYFIKSYHNHKTQIRNYSREDLVIPPWAYIAPKLDNFKTKVDFKDYFNDIGYINVKKIMNFTDNCSKFNFNDHKKLTNVVNNNIDNNPFYISNINFNTLNLITTTLDYYTDTIDETKYKNELKMNDLNNNVEENIDFLKNYMKSILNSNMLLINTCYDQEYKQMGNMYDTIYKSIDKDKLLWSKTLNIFDYIKLEPWTLSLKNKKILLITPYNDLIKLQINDINKIYQPSIFNNSKFDFLDIEMVDINNLHTNNLNKVLSNIDNYDFDIALCFDDIYGNIISHELYKKNKSCINMGNILLLYFGIYTKKDILEYKEAIELYFNSYWKLLT